MRDDVRTRVIEIPGRYAGARRGVQLDSPPSIPTEVLVRWIRLAVVLVLTTY